MDRLARGDDYKVRAAAALALGRAAPTRAVRPLTGLLIDESWQGRERVLAGLLTRQNGSTATATRPPLDPAVGEVEVRGP
jgi:HEAT repeat protein